MCRTAACARTTAMRFGKTGLVLLCYCAALICNLVANAASLGAETSVSKALLIPLLLLYAALKNLGSLNFRNVCFLAALTAAWIGDICLISDKLALFYAGMSAFFAMQVGYSALFWTLKNRDLGIADFGMGMAYMVAGIAFIVNLSADTATYIVCTVYTTLLVSTATAAVRLGRYGVVGGLCFVASDTLLAVQRFAQPTWLPARPYVQVAVMLTYGLAQLCLTYGFVRLESAAQRARQFVELSIVA